MENQELLRAIFEEATLGIIVVDSSGEIKFTNPFLEKLFGFKKKELVGEKVEILLPEAFKKNHFQHKNKLHQNSIPRSMGANLDLYGNRKDGIQFPVEISLSYISTSAEKLAIAYVNDVSHKKEILKDLQLKDKTISSGAMPVAFTDLKGNITDVNDAFVKMWGYNSKEELIGINNSELSSTKEEIAVINNAIREKGTWVGEATAKRKDGSSLDIYVSSSLITDENGIPFLMLASFIDISQLKRTEKELKQILSRFETLSHLAPIGIFLTDREGNCKFVNQKWQEITGIHLQEALGSGWMTAIFSKDKEKFMTASKKAFSQGISCNLEYRVFNKQAGRLYEVLCQVAPILDENDNINSFIGAMSDITEIKDAKKRLISINNELEEKVKIRTNELEESQGKLEKAFKKEQELGVLKSRFVSMASHEFRTPLSSILSSASLIERYVLTDQQDKRLKHINRIKGGVKNLTNILNDFLSLEKLESGMLRCELDLFDIKEYMNEIMNENNLSELGKQEIRYKHSGNVEVFIDPHLVKNVLINLLSNAFKYSPNNEYIEVNSKNENNLLQILVKDRGIGIPKTDHENMFKRFFRASNANNIQGTGLGLTIVKRYVDLMGGEIDFESEEYRGTTFRVSIPQ